MMDDGFDKVREARALLDLPGISEGITWGTIGLLADKKMLVRLREPDVLVLMMDPLENEMRMQLEREIYYETDHYRSSAAVLVHLSKISVEELSGRLATAWRRVAKPKTVRDYDKLSA